MPQPRAIFLMGPTAAGKTALVMRLHRQLPVEVINVDSSQVYRGMDIGTAKPSAEELARVPHRLIDIRDPAQPYSAAEFCQDARKAMEDITRQGRIPLLAGGTIFYFHALEQGLSPLPAADEAVRAQLVEEAAEIGWPAMHARLAAVDPETAARINANDRQRLQRALEILALTGKPPSQSMGQAAPPLPYSLTKIGIAPQDRAVLHERIAQRFEAMLQAGLLEEIQSLIDRGDLSLQLSSMRTVGYRQGWQYLTQVLKHSQMIDKAVAATRQLAKRQLTWMRSYPGLHWLDNSDPGLEQQVLRYLSSSMDNLEI